MNKHLLNTCYVSNTVLCGIKPALAHFIILTFIKPFYKANPVFMMFTIKDLNFM